MSTSNGGRAWWFITPLLCTSCVLFHDDGCGGGVEPTGGAAATSGAGGSGAGGAGPGGSSAGGSGLGGGSSGGAGPGGGGAGGSDACELFDEHLCSTSGVGQVCVLACVPGRAGPVGADNDSNPVAFVAGGKLHVLKGSQSSEVPLGGQPDFGAGGYMHVLGDRVCVSGDGGFHVCEDANGWQCARPMMSPNDTPTTAGCAVQADGFYVLATGGDHQLLRAAAVGGALVVATDSPSMVHPEVRQLVDASQSPTHPVMGGAALYWVRPGPPNLDAEMVFYNPNGDAVVPAPFLPSAAESFVVIQDSDTLSADRFVSRVGATLAMHEEGQTGPLVEHLPAVGPGRVVAGGGSFFTGARSQGSGRDTLHSCNFGDEWSCEEIAHPPLLDPNGSASTLSDALHGLVAGPEGVYYTREVGPADEAVTIVVRVPLSAAAP